MSTDPPDPPDLAATLSNWANALGTDDAASLEEESLLLLAQLPPANLVAVLRRLPGELPQASPHLVALRAQAYVDMDMLDEAIVDFETARLQFTARRAYTDALHAVLNLARLQHLREDLGLARYYTHLADTLLHDAKLDDSRLEADTILRIATLSPDIGLYAQGEEMARRALQIYERRGDVSGQCDALLILFSFHNQTGQYQASGSYLQMARQLQQIAGLGAGHQVAILNKEAHWHWYQGNLQAGMQAVERAVALADLTKQQKQRVYNRLVAGNIVRAMGDFGAAQDWYDATEALANEIGFSLFQCWIDVHRAWLAILQQQFLGARPLLLRALQTQDHGQSMSFSAFQAVLYSLTGRADEAVALLQRSIAYYEQASDFLSVCTLNLHLAFNLLQLEREEEAATELSAAFAWMVERRIDYLPHWWHPSIMARLCVHALAEGIHPYLAERILVKHLGNPGIDVVRPLLHHDSSVVRRRALDVMEALGASPISILASSPDDTVRAVLEELISTGCLAAAGLPHLSTLLTTAEKRSTPNPTLVAVFGLYVHGATREEIARRLSLSEAAVRNYVTLIYRIFGLAYKPRQRKERQRSLRTLALNAGFIMDSSAT